MKETPEYKFKIPEPADFVNIPEWWGGESETLEATLKAFKDTLETLKSDVDDALDTSIEALETQLDELAKRVTNNETNIENLETELEAQGKKLTEWWVYLKENYDYTCDMPADTSTKPYSYTETVKDGEAVKGTLVTTMNADDTYTEVYTIGETTRTRTWSKTDNQWKGVWS